MSGGLWGKCPGPLGTWQLGFVIHKKEGYKYEEINMDKENVYVKSFLLDSK